MKQNTSLRTAFVENEQRGLLLFNPTPALYHAILRRTGTNEISHPARSIFARTTFWNPLTYEDKGDYLLHSVAAKHPRWIFAGPAAAWAYGMTTTYKILSPIHLAVPRKSHPWTWEGTKLLYFRQTDFEACRKENGLRVSDPYRTVFDCARLLPFEEALAIGDRALRLSLIDKEDFARFIKDHTQLKNWKNAEIINQYASPLPESGGESVARALILKLGFMVPELQALYTDPLTQQEYRVDFLWRLIDDKVIIGEFDGDRKYIDPDMTRGLSPTEVLRRERLRESRLSLYDIRLFRFGPQDLKDPATFRELLFQFGVPLRTTS